jgi:hypothetical protein
LTAPVDVPVVVAANRPEAAGPKRVSLPSRLPPPARSAPLPWSTWAAVSSIAWLPPVSNPWATRALPAHRANMAAKMAQPCLRSLTSFPNVKVSANGISRIRNICSRFVNPLGFDSGCAELALRVPPPLVPSSLMASWAANGPPGITCGTPSSVVATVKPWRFWMAPWLTSTRAARTLSGSSTRVVARVRSTQKLPIVALRRRTRPRTSAIATAMPTAADTKFCTASPSTCVRWLTVDSPA